MARSRWIAAAGLFAAALLTGCSHGGSPSAAGGSLSSGPTSVTTPSTSAAPSAPAGATATQPPAGGGTPVTGGAAGDLSLQGIAHEDEQQKGCILLSAQDHRVYLLLGGDRQLIAAGGELRVDGRAAPGLATTCRQGIPFQVSQASRI
jgi:hypothetical protein